MSLAPLPTDLNHFNDGKERFSVVVGLFALKIFLAALFNCNGL
jgi:hypothetical protein